jgi:hypothetical protein
MHQGSDPTVNRDGKKRNYYRGALPVVSMVPQKIGKLGIPIWLKMHFPHNICHIIL